MKTRFFVLLLILFSTSYVFSNKIDEIQKSKELIKNYFLYDSSSSEQEVKYGKLREYFYYSNPTGGIEFYYQLLQHPNVINNEFKKAQIFSALAYLYKAIDKVDIAAKYYFQAINSAKKPNETTLLTFIYIDLGNLMFSIKQYEKAIEYYQKSLNELIAEKLKGGNEERKKLLIDHNSAVAYENIGLCYQNLNQFDSAMHYIRKMENYRLNPSISKINYQYYYKTLGELFLQMGQIDSAIYYSTLSYSFDPSKHISKVDKPEYLNFRSQAEMTLGQAFLLKKMKVPAFNYFQNSIETASLIENPKILFNTYIGISNFLVENGFINEAEKYLNYAKNVIERYPQLNSNRYEIYSLSAEILSRKGKLSDVKTLQDLIISHLDSTIYNMQIQNIKSSELDIELENKLKEIELLNLEKRFKEQQLADQRTKIALLAIIAIVLTASIVMIYFNYQKKRKMAQEMEDKNILLNELNKNLKETLDVSEKLNKELEKSKLELTEINYELSESNKTKNTLFSIIAHDLRNSIGGIRNATTLLSDEFLNLTEDEKLEITKLIKESTNNVYDLLENLLLWASTQSGKIQPYMSPNQPYKILNIVAILINDNLKSKNIILKNNIPEELIFRFDASLLQTIFRNLIHNAIKFSNENGKIEVSAEKLHDEILFCVKDNGVGMPKEKAEKIFKSIRAESSYGTKGEKGTGFGLSIVNEFVKLHNGRIWAESEEEKGTKIYFTFQYLV